MKFREFVGEKKAKEVKRVVKNRVEIKKIERESIETYLGFGISKNNLKRVFDYIKSWLIRYKIPFNSINPYLTLYLLNNLPSVSVFINAVKKTKNKKSIIYKPRGTITIVSSDEKNYPRTYNMEADLKKDYILLDYIPNMEYNKILEDIFDSMDINIILNQCYVKLFEIERGRKDESRYKMYEDMMYSIPRIPNLKLGNIGLLRKRRSK
jgi:hypothetical protein